VRKCFGQIFNGPPDASRFVHYESGANTNREAVVDKFTWAILVVIFPHLPVIPQTSKWTKLGSSLDFFMVSFVNGVLHHTLSQARRSLDYRVEGGGDAGAELSWRELAGQRLARTLTLSQDKSQHLIVRLLCIIIEPLRVIHTRFMKLGHAAPNAERLPALFDEIWDSKSISLRVLAYYSSMLTGVVEHCNRLILVLAPEGHANLQPWQVAQPQQALLIRRLILHAASWVDRRLVQPLRDCRNGWSVFAIGDHRREAAHLDIATTFLAQKECCLVPGLPRELLRRGLTPATLVSAEWKLAFLSTALLTRLTVAYVERRHARHRRSAHQQMPWSSFAAVSVNQEFREQLIAKKQIEACTDRRVLDDQPPRPAPPPPVPLKQVRARGQTPILIFRKKWLDAERAAGRVHNPCKSETWSAVHGQFQNLAADQKQAENPESIHHHSGHHPKNPNCDFRPDRFIDAVNVIVQKVMDGVRGA